MSLGPLAPRSVAQVISAVRSFYAALVRANYVVNNPFAAQRIRVDSTGAAAVRKRSLSDAEWAHVLACIARRGEVAQATVSPELRAQRLARHQRLEAELTTLVDTGLRLAELAAARLGDVRSLGTHAGVPLQVLSVVGKGSKPREVPIGAHTLDLIRRHHAAALGGERRATTGPESERLPLLLRLRESPSVAAHTSPRPASTAALDRSGLHRLLKASFESCARSAPAAGLDPARFEAASTHWLRHTFGRQMAAEGVPVDVLRQTFGHASLATTSRYIDAETERSAKLLAAARQRRGRR